MSVLSVRTDAETDAALEQLGETFGNITDTIRVALQRLAEQERREVLRRAAIAAVNDPADLAETRAVMAEMDELRAW